MDGKFKKKIDDNKAVVGIIGLGYVGLPLVHEFVENGFSTIGFDIDHAKITALQKSESYIRHIDAGAIAAMKQSKIFEATTDFGRLDEPDVIIICVPTPLTPQREPDLTYVISTTRSISAALRKDQLVIFESTSYPGTTDEVLLPILEESGLKCGRDFFLAYSPEREDPGNAAFKTKMIPKVIGGADCESIDRAYYIYSRIFSKIIPVSSAKTAEAVKILENIFRSVNIALVNELKVIYDKMGIDIWEVIEAAKTKPFGFMPFYPGPGPGGHCIPVDPFFLSWKAREYECSIRFIELAGEINTSMPEYIIDKLTSALNEKGKALKNSSILVLGLAYKENLDDIRESPSLKLLKLLKLKGAVIRYHDPFVPQIMKTRKYPDLEGMRSVDLTPGLIGSFDAVLIATAHSNVDYENVVREAQLVVDTRNATGNISFGREKIIKA